MTVVRIIVGVLALAGVAAVLGSVLRTVVLPRGVPARLARLAFLVVRTLLLIRLRLRRRRDYARIDRVLALQAPLGLFAQLLAWALLVFVCFAAMFWALSATRLTGAGIADAVDLSGSSMFTLGFDKPHGVARQLVAFGAAGVGLTLLALVITYLPSVYSAFSRREALITKLTVRAGSPSTGVNLLVRSWDLARFEQLEEVWDGWEDWFIELGESHTTFPQLAFFRSPHPNNHWVLSAEAILDGAVLLMTTCDVPRQSRSELCFEAGINALVAIADFLGVPHQPPPDEDAKISLSPDRFSDGYQTLGEAGVPLREDRDDAWRDFRRMRARYEPLIAVLGRMTDAPRSDWSAWSTDAPRHSPPLIRIHQP